MEKTLRESQLDPFSLLFMAKQPATPAIGCTLFMAGLESSGIHVYVTVFPCEIWVVGRSWLPWLLRTRQGHGCGGGGQTCLPLAATCVPVLGVCLAAVRLHDLPWEQLLGQTAQQDKMPWSSLTMSQVPEIGPGVCSPWSSFEFWHQMASPGDMRSSVTFSSADQLPLPCTTC